MKVEQTPSTKVAMLIRKPVAEVFEAFVDPAITSKFWFTKGSGRLETGKLRAQECTGNFVPLRQLCLTMDSDINARL